MTNTTTTTEVQTQARDEANLYGMRSASGTKTHIGNSGGNQAHCGARVVPYATKHTEITCEKCVKQFQGQSESGWISADKYGFTLNAGK